jgi:predicted dehydrogenase
MLATRSVFQQTLHAFQNGGDPPAGGEAGRDVLAVIAAAYDSAATGRRVVIDEALIARLRDMKLG